MMFNDTAARNINDASQHWQGTVPAQMPWMTDMLSFMPTKGFGCENTPTTNDIIVNQSLPQTKRSSIEVDEDASAPPTKQWLSESMMLSQFGSLNLSNNSQQIHQDSPNYDADAEIEEEDEDDDLEGAFVQKKKPFKQTDSEDLERYVYLLFKDKKQSDQFSARQARQFSQGPNQSTLNRLARDEMDKINKAVVLWNPSIHARPCNTTPEIEELADSDDNCSEKNFIGKNCRIAADETGHESIIITEVFDDDDPMSKCYNNNNYYIQQQMPIDVELVDDLMVD